MVVAEVIVTIPLSIRGAWSDYDLKGHRQCGNPPVECAARNHTYETPVAINGACRNLELGKNFDVNYGITVRRIVKPETLQRLQKGNGKVLVQI